MGGSEHLPCYTKGHRYACQVEATRLHGRDNGHNNGYVALAHTCEHANDEGDTSDDDRDGQGGALESDNNFIEYVSDGQDLNEVQNAEHVDEHFHIHGAHNYFFKTNSTLRKKQNQEEPCGDYAHARACVHIEENYENEGEHYGREGEPQILQATFFRKVFVCQGMRSGVRFNWRDEDDPTHDEGQHCQPAKVQNEFAVTHAGDAARHNHTGDDGAGKLKNMTEPKVDGRLVVGLEVELLASFFHNRGGETRATQGGKQAQEGRHYCQRYFITREDTLQNVDHACQRTACAQLDFQAHNKVER